MYLGDVKYQIRIACTRLKYKIYILFHKERINKKVRSQLRETRQRQYKYRACDKHLHEIKTEVPKMLKKEKECAYLF